MGSYLAAMAVAVFGWGSALGGAMLAYAIVAHCASMADAIRQAAFPGFGPWAPWFVAAVGLGAVGYGPALLAAGRLAAPAWTPDGAFLVDRTAYVRRSPEVGHRVLLDRGGPSGLVRVVAVAGQVVSWSRAGVVVDGGRAIPEGAAVPPMPRSAGAFRVPDRTLLVICGDPACLGPTGAAGGGSTAPHLDLVPVDRVIGRAWARSFPIWRRGLLG